MRNSYYSVYGLYIKQLIQIKRKLGFKYVSGAFILSKIDEFAMETEQTLSYITKDFADKWAKKRPNETEGYRYQRINILAQLSSYMCDLGIPSFMPKLPRYPKNTFIPYIYSQKEMTTLFKASDGLRIGIAHRGSCMFCMPVLLRLLYARGIRIGEALALTDQDVNLEDEYLRIKDSKNGKQRIIPISSSLVSICKEYLVYRELLPYQKIECGYFFVNANGDKCGQGVRQWFKKCLQQGNIPYIGKRQGPRIHDLRHTFAVTSLASMAESGVDLYASLPILSNYLGHQSLGATNHYVRLTASMFPNLIRDMDKTCIDVFPKFRNYEAH